MRITHNQLRQLIRETLTRVIITDEDFLDKIKSEGGIRRGDEGQHVEYAFCRRYIIQEAHYENHIKTIATDHQRRAV